LFRGIPSRKRPKSGAYSTCKNYCFHILAAKLAYQMIFQVVQNPLL